MHVNDSISMTVLAQHLSQLEISGDDKGPAYPLNLTLSFDQDASQGFVIIKHKLIRDFNIGQHIRHLKISDCVIDNTENDIFGGFSPDTLSFTRCRRILSVLARPLLIVSTASQTTRNTARYLL